MSGMTRQISIGANPPQFIRHSCSLEKRMLLLFCLLILSLMPTGLMGSESNLGCRSDQPIRLVQKLPSTSFNASSLYAEYLPEKARIFESSGDQAWCPHNQLRPNELHEWLEIQFPEPTFISNLLTIPRQHKSVDLGEFTKQMLIQYKRSDSDQFRNYSLRSISNGLWHSQVLIKGNSDLKDKRNYLALKPPLVAKILRIYPVNPDPSDVSVCLKIELFGCPTYQGVVAYSGPQGHRLPSGQADFSDHYYDGVISNGRMSGGIGQLTDYVTTIVAPGTDPSDEGIAGLAYVGWSRSQLGQNQDHVELLFEFDRVRRFNSVVIDTNNDFRKWNTRLFNKAEVFFSIGGVRFSESPVEHVVIQDAANMFNRLITFDLGNNIGRFVKARLYFNPDADWMLFSEFTFQSEIVNNPPLTESTDIGSSGSGGLWPPPNPNSNASPSEPPASGSLPPPILASSPVPRLQPGNAQDRVDAPGAAFGRDSELMYIGIIVAILVGALALMASIGVLCLRRRQLRKKQQRQDIFTPRYNLPLHQQQQQQFLSHQSQYKAAETVHLDYGNGRPAVVLGYSTGGHLLQSASYKTLNNNDDDTMTGGEDNRSCGTDAYTYAAASFSPLILPPQQQQQQQQQLQPGDAAAYASTTLCGPHLLQQQVYIPGLGTYARPRGSIPNGIMSLQPQQQQHQSQSLMSRQLPPPPPPPPPPVPRFPSDLNLQGCSGSTVYGCPVAQPSLSDGSPRQLEAALAALEVPLSSVVLKERLGGGKFGEVRLAEWTPPSADSTPAQPLLVAAKTLRSPGSNPLAAEDFRRETRTLARLRDPNIVRVLGVVSGSDLCAVLVEYMQHGDLHQFLQSVGNVGGPEPPLSYGCLVHMAAQVASGMTYLESVQLVHRDLAARNCLLGEAFCVKICDFGMSRPIYSADYYRLDGCAGPLPVRWMAWEALLHGRFTTASDVWSFAVTMWELLTLCRDQPFAGLTDEQVIDNCHHILKSDGAALPLPCPPLCPRELYDLMCQCWQRDESCRPRFRDIRAFLHRRDCGFTAKDASLLRRRRS